VSYRCTEWCIKYVLDRNGSPLWNVILTVRAKASVTAGFMRPPPYFQNIQTNDVIASQLHRTALNICVSDEVRRTAGEDVDLDETSVTLKL